MADRDDLHKRYFDYWDNHERLEQLTARLPQFMGIVVTQLAQAFYQKISAGSLPPTGGDPDEMRRAHEICLEVTRRQMRPYAEVFGEEAWEKMWERIADFISAPSEIIIKLAEDESNR